MRSHTRLRPTHAHLWMWLSAALILAPQLARAADPKAARIEAILRDGIQHGGAAVAVVKRGTVLFAGGFGLADVAARRPVTRGTVFDLASLGKQITGMAVLKLVERGKVGLDDDVRKFVPEVPVFDRGRAITIRDLAGHRSGLPEAPPPADGKRRSVAEVLAAMSGHKTLEFPTGRGWKYTNLNYLLLAVVVERAGGRPFGTFLQKEIFDAAGMKTARFLENPADVIPGRAQGYCLGGKICRWDDGLPGPANVFASLDDMIAWERAVATHALVGAETWRRAFPPGVGYAFGWSVVARQGRLVAWHDGDWLGASTYIARYLDDGLAVIVLANSARAPVEAMEGRIAALFLE